MGQKEADLEAFKASKETILSRLQTEFNIKSLEVGHFSESATETEKGNKDWTDVSNLRNWIPIIIIVAVIVAVVIVARRKRKSKK